jgi:hypothetical protein
MRRCWKLNKKAKIILGTALFMISLSAETVCAAVYWCPYCNKELEVTTGEQPYRGECPARDGEGHVWQVIRRTPEEQKKFEEEERERAEERKKQEAVAREKAEKEQRERAEFQKEFKRTVPPDVFAEIPLKMSSKFTGKYVFYRDVDGLQFYFSIGEPPKVSYLYKTAEENRRESRSRTVTMTATIYIHTDYGTFSYPYEHSWRGTVGHVSFDSVSKYTL